MRNNSPCFGTGLSSSHPGPATILTILLVALVSPPCAEARDWPQFRGPNSSGIGTGTPPVRFGPNINVLWKNAVAPGHSSPCTNGNRLFLTTCDQDKSTLNVECYNRHTGDRLWSTSFAVNALEQGHPSFNSASSSPCCDSEHVVAYFGSYGLVCLNHDGQIQWEKRLPLAKSFGGNATSPIIHDDKIILYRGNYVDHYIACFDKGSGKQLWRVDQSEHFTGEMACTATPITHENMLICHSARCIQAFETDSGKRLWIAQCATTATSTPIVVGDEVLVAAWNKLGEPDLRPPFPSFDELISNHDKDDSGAIAKQEFPTLWIFHRPEGIEAPMNGAPVSFRHADKNKDGQIDEEEWIRTTTELEEFRAGYKTHGLIAVPIESKGHVSSDDVRVLTTRGIPEVPSPIADGRIVYLLKNGGLLNAVDSISGDILHRIRTTGSGTHYASPLIAGGRLYCFSGNGRVTVVDLKDEPRIVAVNEMNESLYATPAIVDGVIYLRSQSMLYAFGETPE